LIESIGASQDDQDGVLAQCRMYALYDGTNLPIVHNTGVDLSGAPTPAFTSEYFLGPVYHNGSEIEGILSTSVQFNTMFSTFRTSGNVHAKQGYIARRSPVLQLTTLKSDVDAAVSHFLRAASGTLAFYYWKGVDAGDRVAVATGGHVKVSAATSVLSDDSLSITENDDATTTITILPSGSLGYTITSAIP
jgi:hypothetical protein